MRARAHEKRYDVCKISARDKLCGMVHLERNEISRKERKGERERDRKRVSLFQRKRQRDRKVDYFNSLLDEKLIIVF